MEHFHKRWRLASCRKMVADKTVSVKNHYSKIQGRCQRKMAKMDDFPAFPTSGDQKNGRNEEVPGGKW
jgi:hypothetical protein